MNFGDIAGWFLIFYERAEMIPFGCNRPTVGALKGIWCHTENYQRLFYILSVWLDYRNDRIDESVRYA